MILDILGRESTRAAREGTAVGVIMADLDHFKRVNDTSGTSPATPCSSKRRGE